jgi:GNAT superfamily N-acetyltransferase
VTVRIERATEADVPLVLSFIRKLAEYERKSDQVSATEEGLREALFGARPMIEVLIAFSSDEPVGFALYFTTFSTFRGQPGLFLEDLFVEPAHRGKKIGTALLAALANIARERGYIRLEWWVLKWNQPAIGFYKRLGATEVDEWGIYRLEGAPLDRMAGKQN